MVLDIENWFYGKIVALFVHLYIWNASFEYFGIHIQAKIIKAHQNWNYTTELTDTSHYKPYLACLVIRTTAMGLNAYWIHTPVFIYLQTSRNIYEQIMQMYRILPNREKIQWSKDNKSTSEIFSSYCGKPGQ